jgi:hypothetical protein
MSEHDEGRRAFIVGAVGAGAAAGTGFVQTAYARTHNARPADTPRAVGEPADPGHTEPFDGHGVFLNDDQAATVAAFAERLMPGGVGLPGATDAGVLNYIDLALAGAYADQQDVYRRGLAQLDAFCRATFKAPFVKLGPAAQDDVILALEQGRAGGFDYPTGPAFFNLVRTHTMEGMFADPAYGGNRDFAGWKLVGYPGTQLFYTKADMASTSAFTRAPITGLRAQAGQSKSRSRKA